MSNQARILIVDDDPIVADSLAEFLGREGYRTATAGDGNEALALLDKAAASHAAAPDDEAAPAPFGLVVTDVNMPRADGMELLKAVRKNHPAAAVITITGYGKIESAVEAIKLGAVDYLTKPVVDEELLIAVNRAMQQHVLMAENATLRSQLAERFGMGSMIGSDYRMQRVYDLVEAVAESKTTVLIDGESGTGKTMVARAIHTRSERSAGPFVTFSCGSIPETLLESELFGHVKGAFTSADHDKEGKILAADGGTVFIDEINSATPALQIKLLRLLQEKQVEPVGSTKTVTVDVRFILATNQSLQELVEQGIFREDLYYRINVVNIHLPSLCERVGDIVLLADHFLEKHGKEAKRTITGFTEEALAALQRYHWRGNVRELENAVERAVVLSRRPIIDVDDLPDTVRAAAEKGVAVGAGATVGVGGNGNGRGGTTGVAIPALEGGWNPMPLSHALEDPERQIILAALEANSWNRQVTARQLDINRTTLYKKIKQFQLDQPR